MFISGATSKAEVSKILKAASEKSKKFNYSAKKINSPVGKIWKVTKTKK